MITVRVSADIREDRRVVSEPYRRKCLFGPSELIVSVAAKAEPESTRSSFSLEWAEETQSIGGLG